MSGMALKGWDTHGRILYIYFFFLLLQYSLAWQTSPSLVSTSPVPTLCEVTGVVLKW